MNKRNKPEQNIPESNLSFKEQFFNLLGEYGNIEKQKTYDIAVEGKNRKYIKIIHEGTTIDLVEILRDIKGYSFFFFEGQYFEAKQPFINWKKEIYYDKEHIQDKIFPITLLHEVSHFPMKGDSEYSKNELKFELPARLEGLHMAKTLKDRYNVCLLSGFKNQEELYNYVKSNLKTYGYKEKK